MNVDLFQDGCLVMFIGMGTVFFFLVLMIILMNIVAKIMPILNKIMPEEVEIVKPQKRVEKDNDAEIALAIACAISRGGKTC